MSSEFSEEWVEGPRATAFYTRTYKVSAPNAAIVFVHGFIEHIARYSHVFPQWASAGISVFSFDQRGFGRTATDVHKKSPSSSWGVTSWVNQQEDIAFFLNRERKRLGSSVPLFLVGHSMGGAEALGFGITPPVNKGTLGKLAGIVASSPLIRQSTAEPAWKLWLGDKAAKLFPGKQVDTPVDSSALSHDPEVSKQYDNDPLIRPFGSLRGVADMLSQGIAMASINFKYWPNDMPVLLLHGESDRITSCKATEKFYNDIQAKDKSLSIYSGGYHELANEPNGERWMDEISKWILEHAVNTATERSKL